LIAHGANAAEVFAAADADGAYLPLLTYILPADTPPFAGKLRITVKMNAQNGIVNRCLNAQAKMS
jgi:hypothetical protein